jgi:predicted KAP-like P-loop ATPase
MSKAPPTSDHKWNADRPVERPEDDKLGRKAFAQRVAKELRAWRQKDSLVISLNGDWGSGKTTLANLILFYAEEQAASSGEKKPTVVRFNPWQWSAQDKLLQAFFDEIGAAFRHNKVGDEALAKRLARFWEGLKVITAAGGELASRFREPLIAAAALLAGGGSGVLSAFLANPTGKTILGWTGAGLLGLSTVCVAYAALAEKLAAIFQWKTSKVRSLEEIRRSLQRELAKLEAPVIVVVDDLDRLAKDEVRLMVQLVKANADFPNLVYLLLCQKDVLVKALGEITSENGQDFLKKIVQVELEVPLAPEHELRSFFHEQITPVLKRAEMRWEKERWDEVFEEGVWPYFRTPRDIKRFKGVLEFYFEAHAEAGVLEVNPIDLILLETLRMFDSDAYEAVGRAFQKQRNLFIELLFNEKDAKDRLTIGIKELLTRKDLTPPEQERLKIVLYALFPQAQDGFSMSDRTEQDWERNLRLCHPKLFRRYFQIGGDPGDISAAFIASLLKADNDTATIRGLLKQAFDSKPFTALMDRLRAVVKDVPQPTIEPLLIALFDLSDSLPEITPDILLPDAERQLAHFAVQLLRQISDDSARAALFRRAVLATTAITGPATCASLLQPSKEDAEIKRVPLVPLEALKEVQSDLLPRLREAAVSGRLWQTRTANLFLFLLVRWSSVADVRGWLAQSLTNPETAMAFLRATLNRTQASGHRGTRTIYSLSLTHTGQFADLKSLAAAAATAPRDQLDKAAIEKLQAAVSAKQGASPQAEIYVLTRDEAGQWTFDPSDSRT